MGDEENSTVEQPESDWAGWGDGALELSGFEPDTPGFFE